MHNPSAGHGKHRKKDLMAALAKTDHHAVYQSTKKRGYEKALKKPGDLVLVAGGDGTVTKIARRLIDTGIPLAVLPLGTANNLARTLGFIVSPEELIARLEDGKKHSFDVGVARGPWGTRYFFEGAGAGLLADYVRAAKKEDKKPKSRRKTARWLVMFHCCASYYMIIRLRNGRSTSTARMFPITTSFGKQ